MNKILFSTSNDCWETPIYLFIYLNDEFGFTIDAMANSNNKLCDRYYSIENSFLDNYPENEVIYCNPPYSRNLGKIIKHCNDLRKLNNTIVLLIPARTDTKWFHEYLYNKDGVELRFLKGRLKFTLNKINYNSATFPSMIVVMKPIK